MSLIVKKAIKIEIYLLTRYLIIMKTLSLTFLLIFFTGIVYCQDTTNVEVVTEEGEQNRESMAVDATAAQWSFQLAYQWMPDYHDDIVNGEPRRPGLDNYVQLRVVAPIPINKTIILPRLTIRHYEDLQNGKSGFGNTELFALVIPGFSNWGTGRTGIGPLITAPGNKDVARDEWGYGFAAALVQNSGNFFFGLLFTQTWRSVDPRTLPPGESNTNPTSNTNPLGIAPFLNYRIADGWYVQTADIVALYDWNTKKFYLPLGLRAGKVWVWEKSSLNVYLEYKTSAIYKEWEGPAVKNSYRFNVSYTIPIGK